jgi:hypothetical protein
VRRRSVGNACRRSDPGHGGDHSCSIDVSPGLTEIGVTYSKPVQDGSWSWSTWGEENFPETTGSPRYLADGRTCVLPVKLEPGRFYAIWLNSDRFKNFQDAGGRPAVPYLLTFVTTTNRPAEEDGPLQWLREARINLDSLSLDDAPYTQVMIEDVQADGRTRFRNVIRQRILRNGEPLRRLQFINSDHANIERMVDAEGRRILFNQTHQGRIYRYTADLETPVPPGETLLYGSEGSMDTKIQREDSGDLVYRFTHSPGGMKTRRVELHRLPAGKFYRDQFRLRQYLRRED